MEISTVKFGNKKFFLNELVNCDQMWEDGENTAYFKSRWYLDMDDQRVKNSNIFSNIKPNGRKQLGQVTAKNNSSSKVINKRWSLKFL